MSHIVLSYHYMVDHLQFECFLFRDFLGSFSSKNMFYFYLRKFLLSKIIILITHRHIAINLIHRMTCLYGNLPVSKEHCEKKPKLLQKKRQKMSLINFIYDKSFSKRIKNRQKCSLDS